MNVEALANVLKREGFKKGTYSLHPTFQGPNEQLCLRHEKGTWVVFYGERGLQTDKVSFESEEAACDHFLAEMRKEPDLRSDSRKSHT